MGVGTQYQLIMDALIEDFEDISLLLMGIVNSVDRTKALIVDTYPDWDEVDTAEFKTQTIARLNMVISKLEAL